MSAAFQLVIAVQLDLHIALSLNAQGGFSFVTIPWVSGVLSGVAHINFYVFQGEVQHRIGNFVDHRNGVLNKAICLGRGCRGSSRGCLLGLLPGVLLPVSVLRLVCAFRFLSALRLVCIFRLVCAFRFLSVLRLGRLVVVLYHRAKAGILCCGAFQVALLRGDGLSSGGDDDLTPVIVLNDRSVLFDLLAAIIFFGDDNVAVVDIVGPCKGRSRQRHRDAQRCQQSCCPAECVGLPHGRGLLSFSTLSCAFCALFVEGAFFQIVPPPPPIFSIGENNKVFTQNPQFCGNVQ